MKTSPRIIILLALLCSLSSIAQARPGPEAAQAIDHLLQRIAGSGLVFVRNHTNHDAREAAAHIGKKYRYYIDDIETPEDFIERCASKSLLTGNEYQVIDAQGRRLPSRDWLLRELAAYRKQR